MFHVMTLVASFISLAFCSDKRSIFDLNKMTHFILLLHEKFLQFDWLRAVTVIFQLNLKYRHVKITNHLWVVV